MSSVSNHTFGLAYDMSGIDVIVSPHVQRGVAFILGSNSNHMIVFGLGRMRGVPYTVIGRVWRGYVIDRNIMKAQCKMIDAVTGKVSEWVNEEDMIPTPEGLTGVHGSSTLAL